MNIKNTLDAILRYYAATRQVGHTTAVLEGARATNALVVCHNHQYSKDLQHGNRRFETTSLENLGDKLRGHNSPLVFDNAAMMDLCSASYNWIEHLENELEASESNLSYREKQVGVLQNREGKNEKEISDLKEKIKSMETDMEMYRKVILKMSIELYY